VFVLGKTGTNQKQEAKKCKDGFQFIFLGEPKCGAFFLGSQSS
jgi:hypothetical protein